MDLEEACLSKYLDMAHAQHGPCRSRFVYRWLNLMNEKTPKRKNLHLYRDSLAKVLVFIT